MAEGVKDKASVDFHKQQRQLFTIFGTESLTCSPSNLNIRKTVKIQGSSFRAGLHAACHVLLNVVPLFIQCNSSDLASEYANPHDTRYFPERILLYDQHPGGLGISAQVQPLFRELLSAALDLLTAGCCSAVAGCPHCVQTLACHEYNEVLDKNAAITILKGVIEAEDSNFSRQSETCTKGSQ